MRNTDSPPELLLYKHGVIKPDKETVNKPELTPVFSTYRRLQLNNKAKLNTNDIVKSFHLEECAETPKYKHSRKKAAKKSQFSEQKAILLGFRNNHIHAVMGYFKIILCGTFFFFLGFVEFLTILFAFIFIFVFITMFYFLWANIFYYYFLWSKGLCCCTAFL